MRLLVDEYELGLGSRPGRSPHKCFAYTNHTLLPEALETWPLALFERVLPRHLEIIYEINRRFLDEVRARFPATTARVARMSLIDEHGETRVRMAHLACVGSHAINGVAELHTDCSREPCLRDFHELWPEKFNNKTNGVTPRRFAAGQPAPRRADHQRHRRRLGHAISTSCASSEPFADDAAFRAKWRAVKRDNKQELAAVIRTRTGVAVDPDSLFDVQVKRMHEYKRQHLNVLHIITLY